MKHFVITCCVLLACLFLQFCTTSRSSAGGPKAEAKTSVVSYANDIAPVMQTHCTPCHFPNGGKKKFLDTYGAVRDNFDDILFRVQLPADSSAFMPFRSKKEPLSDSLIQVFVAWKATGMTQ